MTRPAPLLPLMPPSLAPDARALVATPRGRHARAATRPATRQAAPALALLAALLGACSSGPPVPDWQLNAHSAQARSISAYLVGKDSVAQSEFARARTEVGSTGKASLAIRIELAQCAARVASMVFDDCPGFGRLRADATAADTAYLQYLSGQAVSNTALLPEQHRAVAGALAAGNEAAAAAAVAAIADPLSRLVAAGAVLRAGHAAPPVLTTAVDTASDQGWRRPLLAWLEAQALRAEKAGDAQAAAQVRRRMALVTATP
jgi:hypothetical protein